MSHILLDEGLTAGYEERPPYQRTEYLGWIGRAKRPQAREDRFEQMVDEIRRGGVYLDMSHPPSATG